LVQEKPEEDERIPLITECQKIPFKGEYKPAKFTFDDDSDGGELVLEEELDKYDDDNLVRISRTPKISQSEKEYFKSLGEKVPIDFDCELIKDADFRAKVERMQAKLLEWRDQARRDKETWHKVGRLYRSPRADEPDDVRKEMERIKELMNKWERVYNDSNAKFEKWYQKMNDKMFEYYADYVTEDDLSDESEKSSLTE